MIHIEIVATGFNCERYVERCVRSVFLQKYQHWNLTLIDDGSKDRTPQYFNRIKDSRISCHRFIDNQGATFRRYNTIKAMSNNQSVVLLLGMDDELLPNCLEVIKRKYESGCWMTYGNWVNQIGRGLPSDFQLEFDDATHASRSYRSVTYRSTAPNTFRKFLFDMIPATDFQINGEWIKTTTESEIMYSCLEMSGEKRIGVIHQPIYLYNQHRNSVSHRLGQGYKNRIHEIIKSRPKKPLYENIECLSQ